MISKTKNLRKRKSLFFYLFLGVLVVVIIGFLVDANFKINKKRKELLSQINYLEKEIQALEEKKAKYGLEISKSESQDFWEEKIREQGYKRPGEETVVVLPKEETKEEETPKEKSFWQKFLEFLKIK